MIKYKLPRHVVMFVVVVATVVVLFDQFTKYLVLTWIKADAIIEVIPSIFNLQLVFNKGAAFGMFSEFDEGVRQIVLGVTAAIALAIVGCFLVHQHFSDRSSRAALGLILGGAIGNIIDRFRFGAVVDFLDFYIGKHHWPAFNVADSAICLGVAVLILLPGKKKASPDVVAE